MNEYIIVTNDAYELPVSNLTGAKAVAEYLGLSVNRVRKNLCTGIWNHKAKYKAVSCEKAVLSEQEKVIRQRAYVKKYAMTHDRTEYDRKRYLMKKCMVLMLLTVLWCSQTFTAVAKDNDTYLSDEIQGYCVEIGEKYGVCPELLMAIIEKESSGNPTAENRGCCGLMQISPKYHSDRMERLGVTDIYDPYGNILVGTDYLMELAEEYEDIGVVLMYYNGDSKADDFARGECELSGYADWILNRSAELEMIHGK